MKYRGDHTQKFYQSREWRAFRARMLPRLRPHGCAYCRRPFEPGERHLQLDHIQPLKENWARRLDPSNVRLLHIGCHTERTHRPDRRRPVNNDGLPDDWV
ncbi:HNH endonuclease [Primorskyibacter sp. S87]|uniref:HNH endonuclease n=1 Tax=Primorskyibacter sp. S87 TaxID=3415126 RepID=UPI003C7BB8C0